MRMSPSLSQAAGALLPFFLSNGVPGYSKEENVGWEGYSEAEIIGTSMTSRLIAL